MFIFLRTNHYTDVNHFSTKNWLETVISRSSASKVYQSKACQRAMFMRLTMVRNVYDAVPVKHESIISVGVNTFKTKGILVFSRIGYLSMLGPRTFIIFMLFLTLEHKRRNSLLLLSRIAPSFPLQAINSPMHAIIINHGSWCLSKQESNKSGLVS